MTKTVTITQYPSGYLLTRYDELANARNEDIVSDPVFELCKFFGIPISHAVTSTDEPISDESGASAGASVEGEDTGPFVEPLDTGEIPDCIDPLPEATDEPTIAETAEAETDAYSKAFYDNQNAIRPATEHTVTEDAEPVVGAHFNPYR